MLKCSSRVQQSLEYENTARKSKLLYLMELKDPHRKTGEYQQVKKWGEDRPS